ncbi:MAG TPA: ATP-binding protein, partial [Blastocatellia bacterium]|nr:ATP-binding protein [Blastocatellia bacterium]
ARAEAEAARREAERERASLNAVIEQMGEALIVFDEKARVIRANWHAQRIFGFTAEEMASKSLIPLIEGRFSDEEGRILSLAEMPVRISLREGRVVDSRIWYTRPDGKKILLSHNSSPFYNSQNEIAGAIALARDITEQHREDERVQQADKLRALGQLASGVAHNFNNALAAVIGYTQLALPKIKDPDIEKYLKVVEKSAKDAARMVERIQNFSRGRSRADDFLKVRLPDILRDAVDITSPRWRTDAEALGIKYDVRLDCEEDLQVNGEPSELREVFVNIILNALDAMSVGGSLTITGSTDGPNAVLRFTDTGSGMTEEIKRRIFEPFFTTKGVSGLGLGLSESYRIIERHGGRIDVESQLRHGTTFTILLPLAAGAPRQEQAPLDSLKAPSARVLVIDDEEFVRSLLATVLTGQGSEVVEAASAEEALDILGRREFDIVFTDLAMPKTDGIAAAAEIKARWPGTKVVLMSGYGAEKAIELAGEGGSIDAAISKPFNMAEVTAVVKRVLAKD